MQNFTFHNPTRIHFGKGSIARLPREISPDERVLFLYGGGSIRTNGVHAAAKAALGSRHVVEFSGIEANPDYATCLRALELVRREQLSYILAVGGGSVLDAAKFIAAAAELPEETDPWGILTGSTKLRGALPIGAVLTLPATGSEANGNSVISRRETTEKLAFSSPHVYPRFSVLDPEYTYSLPQKQVRNGIVDAYVHVLEQYATVAGEAPLQDRWAEGILHTLREVGPKTLANASDYDARASFMWAATAALNGAISVGVTQDWATHMIGHELTAFYGIDHAESLAITLFGVWRERANDKGAKLDQYAQRSFGTRGVEGAIEGTESFFRSLGMGTRFGDYGIDASEAARRVAERLQGRGEQLGEGTGVPLDRIEALLLGRA